MLTSRYMSFKDTGYKYYAPMHKSLNIQFDADAWTKCIKLYEKKRYKESMKELLNYSNKNIKKHQTSKDIYKVPHGSISVDIDFSGDEIIIGSDFLDISEANKIPLLRRVAELNFSGANLSQIVLEGDKLKFEYTTPVSLYTPYKIFDVLAEICYFADKYDEEFCESFGAKELSEAMVTDMPEAKKKKVYDNFVSIIESNLKVIEDLESDRRNHNAWDVISTTYKMIDFACAPKGSLALKISEQVSELYSRESSLETIIFRGKEFLIELKNMEYSEFSKFIYGTQEFIPNKKVATNEYIAQYLDPGYRDAQQALQAGDSQAAYIIFMHILYNSLYYHIMPTGFEKAIKKIIQKYSDKAVNKSNVTKFSDEIFKLTNLREIPSNKSGFLSIALAGASFIIGSMLGG